MRPVILLLFIAFASACANKNASEQEFVTRIGVITSKEVVELEEARTDSRVNTGVSVSASSGGGMAIGLGFLFSPWSGSSAQKAPVRYDVELMDGETLTVYHDSDLFEVDDCVEISSLEGDSNPPLMKRLKGGCGDPG